MLSKIQSLGCRGVSGYAVSVECHVSNGLPGFDIVGLPDAAVKEARERVRSAIKTNGMKFPVSRLTVNLAPADTRKAGTLYDLPVLLGILCAIWRALAQHRKNYLKTEARNTVAVHHQKEANREHE